MTELAGQADRLKEGLQPPVEVVPPHEADLTSQLLCAKGERITELEARVGVAEALPAGSSKRSSDTELAGPPERHCSISKPTCCSIFSAESCTLQDTFSARKGQHPLSASGHLSNAHNLPDIQSATGCSKDAALHSGHPHCPGVCFRHSNTLKEMHHCSRQGDATVVCCMQGDKKWRLDKAADPKQRAQLGTQWKWKARMWQLVNIGFPGLTAAASCAALDASLAHGRQPIPARSKWELHQQELMLRAACGQSNGIITHTKAALSTHCSARHKKLKSTSSPTGSATSCCLRVLCTCTSVGAL